MTHIICYCLSEIEIALLLLQVKLNEVASQLLNSTRQCSVPQSVIKIKSQLLGYYQIVWSCNHHQQALPKGNTAVYMYKYAIELALYTLFWTGLLFLYILLKYKYHFLMSNCCAVCIAIICFDPYL